MTLAVDPDDSPAGAASAAAAAGWPAASRIAAALGALAFFAEGIGTQAMGLAVPAMLRDWSIPRAALAMPTALGLVGFALGAIAGGLAGDRFRHRGALAASVLLLGVFTAVCALTHDPVQLGLTRVVAGVGLGASLPIATTVIAEAAPMRHRSLVIAVGLAFLPLGGFSAGLGASLVLPRWGWRGLFLAAGGLAILFALAIAASARVPRSRIAIPSAPLGDSPLSAGRAQFSFGASLEALFAASHRRDTLGIWGAFFCVVLIYYSMFSWAPAALTAQGLSVAAASRVMSGFSVGGLIGGLLTGVLVQRLGSRVTLWLLCAGAVASGLALPHLAHAAASGRGPLTAAIVLFGITIIGLQTLLYAVGAHAYDERQRATGIGFAVGAGRLGAIASAYTGVIALDLRGVHGFFGSLVLATLLALLCGLTITRHVPRMRLTAREPSRWPAS